MVIALHPYPASGQFNRVVIRVRRAAGALHQVKTVFAKV